MRFNLTKILSLLLLSTLIIPTTYAKTFLVSVGINDYTSFPDKLSNLLLPVNDAKGIANVYAGNGSVEYVLLTDKQASKSAIKQAMKKVYGLAGKDDQLVLFFSGHGYSGGVCASDGKLPYDEIKDAMSIYLCNNKLLLIDACRAGGFRRVPSKSRTDISTTTALLFLASRDYESSIERKDMKNGFFTQYLINGLRGKADTNRDRNISAKELYDYVSERVILQSNGLQHPVMWGNFNDSTTIMKW